MKIERMIIMIAMLTMVGIASADNLTVSDVELSAGETKEITIDLNNPDKVYTAFQFDLVLPEGVTIALNNKNKLIASLDGDRADDHTLNVANVGNNTYRFLSFSMTNADFYDTSGPLVHVSLLADENITSGIKIATVKNQVITQSDGTQFKWGEFTFNITIPEPIIPMIVADNKSRKYGEENPEFTYQVTVGELTGTPELTTTATITSSIGTYPITVSRGTVEGNYESTDGTLTIEQAPLTIAAGTYTKKQGEALPEFTLTYTGFKNGETESVLTTQPVVTCAATAASAPGEYAVTVSGATAQNYEISYTAGKLIVTEADPVTITAKSYTRKYGEANPTFEFTTEGAALEGIPVISCAATATSPVGTYPITVTKGTVANYNVTYVAGTLTIEQAPLTIAAGTYTKKQGEALPEFTLTYTGFKNGEDESVLLTQPTVTTTADVNSPAGEYAIVVSGAEAQNYEISYVNGTLIITPATGIDAVRSNSVGSDAWYDLSGRKLQSIPVQKGIYILNGKKVVIK